MVKVDVKKHGGPNLPLSLISVVCWLQYRQRSRIRGRSRTFFAGIFSLKSESESMSIVLMLFFGANR